MFKPGFFGKSPPRWFIGQVAMDQTSNKTSYEGWGDRVKVRIMGYHPKEGTLLPDSDLPWAIVLRPSTHGSLNRTSTALGGGEWVVGIFLDDDSEKPMIIGVLGRTDPSYDVSGNDIKSQKSTEFQRTLNWYGDVTPQNYHLKTTTTPSSTPLVPSLKDFGLKL
jgi:hypothetical protein